MSMEVAIIIVAAIIAVAIITAAKMARDSIRAMARASDKAEETRAAVFQQCMQAAAPVIDQIVRDMNKPQSRRKPPSDDYTPYRERN